MYRPVLTPAEMAAADRRTIDAGTPFEELIDRAAHAVARSARRLLGGTYGRRVLIVCGKGNNGQDGVVAAQWLNRWGTRAVALLLNPTLDRASFDRELARADLVVDAMYGTGFRGHLEGDAAWVVGRLGESGVPVLAVDIPSGVHGSTGQVSGPAVRADHTVTFAAYKPGLLFEPGRSLAGRVDVADIGIDLGPVTVGAADVDTIIGKIPERHPSAHKWTSAVLVVAGSPGMAGAAALAGRAAARAGAGMVVVAASSRELADQLATMPGCSELVIRVMDDLFDGVIAAAERCRAVVLGPGLGADLSGRAAIRRLVAELPIPTVVDADGLNALAGDLDPLRAASGPRILTPHGGEHQRLIGAKPPGDRLLDARALALSTGSVVLLKGPGTVIASPSGRAVIEQGGRSSLATAGTGDVLAGIIGAMLARGLEPFDAAVVGAVTHAAAADEAGHTGLIASDLIEALPPTLERIRKPASSKSAASNTTR